MPLAAPGGYVDNQPGTAALGRNEHRRLAALAYADLFGWPVLPLHSVDAHGQCTCWEPDCDSSAKHPRTTHGLSEASTDLDVIAAWWSKWPTANVGIRCGAPGPLVIDVDDRA